MWTIIHLGEVDAMVRSRGFRIGSLGALIRSEGFRIGSVGALVRSGGLRIGSVGALIRSRGFRIAPVGALALALACGPEPPGGGSAAPAGGEDRDTVAERVARDLAAIEALHRQDQEASLAGDWPTLIGLWSDDPVALPPDGPVQRGRAAVEQSMEQYRAAAELWETVEYVQDFGEVEVMGDYAWDWGTFRGRSRNRRTGREVSSSGKLLRILKRAPDGSWKVHRSIWNVAPGGSPDAPPDTSSAGPADVAPAAPDGGSR